MLKFELSRFLNKGDSENTDKFVRGLNKMIEEHEDALNTIAAAISKLESDFSEYREEQRKLNNHNSDAYIDWHNKLDKRVTQIESYFADHKTIAEKQVKKVDVFDYDKDCDIEARIKKVADGGLTQSPTGEYLSVTYLKEVVISQMQEAINAKDARIKDLEETVHVLCNKIDELIGSV